MGGPFRLLPGLGMIFGEAMRYFPGGEHIGFVRHVEIFPGQPDRLQQRRQRMRRHAGEEVAPPAFVLDAGIEHQRGGQLGKCLLQWPEMLCELLGRFYGA
jgi:hypothetical protein